MKNFLIGTTLILVGGFFGFVIFACCLASKRADAKAKHHKWNKLDKIKIKQIEGLIEIPTRYVYAECPNCNHCFIMVCTSQYKYCPNCGEVMKSESDTE